jgi:hypothetical protein
LRDDTRKERMVSWTLPLQVTFAKRDNGMNYDPGSFTGQVILNLNVALVVITSVFMLVRLYVRAIMTRGLGRDDVLATIAWVSWQCSSLHLKLQNLD